MRRIVTTMCLIALLLCLPQRSSAQPQTLTYTAAEDTFVSQATPTTAFGTSTTFSALGGAGQERQSFLRFTGISVPVGSEVVSVTLRLFVTNASVGAFVFSVPTGTWSETTTWNDKPAVGTQLATVTGLNLDSFIDIALPVSSLVGNTVDLAIVTSSGDQAAFASSEYATVGNRPQLLVTTQVTPTPTATIQPTPTGCTVADWDDAGSYYADMPGGGTVTLVSGAPSSLSIYPMYLIMTALDASYFTMVKMVPPQVNGSSVTYVDPAIGYFSVESAVSGLVWQVCPVGPSAATSTPTSTSPAATSTPTSTTGITGTLTATPTALPTVVVGLSSIITTTAHLAAEQQLVWSASDDRASLVYSVTGLLFVFFLLMFVRSLTLWRRPSADDDIL